MRVLVGICLAASMLLAGCGGGDSVEDPGEVAAAQEHAEFAAEASDLSQPATFRPRVLRLNFSRNSTPGGSMTPVTVRVADPGGPLFFGVTSRTRVLTGGPVEVSFGDRPNEYQVYMPVRKDLRVGVHTGEIRLILCRDPACVAVHPASGAVLPYSFTVTEEFTFGVTVNGVERDPTRPILVRDGARIGITASAPATWLIAMGGAHFGSSRTTRTSFEGTAEYGQSPPIGNARLTVRVIEVHPGEHREFHVDFTVKPPERR